MEKYRIDQSKMEFGIYTLGDTQSTGERISAAQRIHEIIDLAKLSGNRN